MINARHPRPSRSIHPRRQVQTPERPRVTGTVYAIGDVHGRLDCLEELIRLIREDVEKLPATDSQPLVILLGDLIDRGPDSAGCIARAMTLAEEDWCALEALKGNHEQALLQFLDDPGVGPSWVQHGGGATLKSYGVALDRADPSKGWAGVQASFQDVFPEAHRTFLDGMKLWVERDGYLFVHAGIRPGVPMDQQTETDLLWIRSEFLRFDQPHPSMVVVHGHTPRREPDLHRWRIGLDTGAYASGVLTAIRLRGAERTVIQAR